MNPINYMPKIKLGEAIREYQKMPGAVSNSYGWYRNSAKKSGAVSIGEANFKVFKDEGVWWLKRKDFDHAIKLVQEARERLLKTTEDLSKGIVHGKNGETIEFEGGRYTIYGDFRFETSYYELYRKRSEGSWYCNKCNDSADIKGNKVTCTRCGASHKIYCINSI